MLENYYELRGWNWETGIPEIETLENLGLNKAAADIKKIIQS
jgi:aldehyde:ferredoxin oxidoreductase